GFTDLAMPGVSGWQVAQAVKSTTPAVPVFVVTGFGVELSREERGAHDVDAVYAKPLKIEDVMDAVARIARRRASRQQTEAALMAYQHLLLDRKDQIATTTLNRPHAY